MLQDFFANVIFNVVVASSFGAAGATTFARPPSGSMVPSLVILSDAPSEIVNDVEWTMAMG
jgi:hypothetical protein